MELHLTCTWTSIQQQTRAVWSSALRILAALQAASASDLWSWSPQLSKSMVCCMGFGPLCSGQEAGDARAPLVCFPSLGVHCPTLPVVHCPKMLASYVSSFLVYGRRSVWLHHDCKEKSAFLLIFLMDMEDLKGISWVPNKSGTHYLAASQFPLGNQN